MWQTFPAPSLQSINNLPLSMWPSVVMEKNDAISNHFWMFPAHSWLNMILEDIKVHFSSNGNTWRNSKVKNNALSIKKGDVHDFQGTAHTNSFLRPWRTRQLPFTALSFEFRMKQISPCFVGSNQAT